MKHLSRYVLASLSLAASICSKDFGSCGQTFPIEEENLRSFLQRKLLQTPQKMTQLQESIRDKARHPTALKEVKYAKKSKKFLFDPSIRVKRDIFDLKGNILAKEGSLINPLNQIKLSSGLLFLDGSSKAHILWARSQQGNFKWILVKGSPIELEEAEKRPVFFDQTRISARFNIQHYPAKITQKDDQLLVEEIPIDHLGKVL